MKTRRLPRSLLSIILILYLILNNSYNINAFVQGESGNVSPSEGYNTRGGINWLVYKVCIVNMEGKNQLTGENILKPTDTAPQIMVKFNRHFSKKFPRILDYTLFVEDTKDHSIWTPNAYLSEYNPSNNALEPIDDIIKSKKLHRLKSKSNPGNIFYSNLSNEIKSMSDLKEKYKTDKNWWKRVYNNTSNKETNSVQLWNYILGTENNIEGRIEEYTGIDKENDNTLKTETPEDKLEKKLKYLDLLLTLYTLDETLREDLEKVLPNYIYDIDILKKPLLISIESGIRVSSTDLWKDKVFSYMSSTDYLMYMYGAVQGITIYDDPLKPKDGLNNDTKSIFERSYTSSFDALPGIFRLTEKFQKQTKNPFSFGMSGIIGGYFSTKNGTPNWNYWSDHTGVMHGLKFAPEQIGFILIGTGNNLPDPNPNLTIKMNATAGPDGKKKYIVPVENETIGVNSYIDITLSQDSISQWNLLYNDPNIKYDFKLSLTSTEIENITKLNPSSPNINTKIININKDELFNILDSKHSFRYQQDFTTTPIAEGETKHIEYTAKLEVDYILNSEKIHKETEIAKDYVDFSRGRIPPELTGSYTSTTEVFSEIKQGNPGNETFEAMAGVPTTRNLYFSSGGAEYIVDVAVKFQSGQQTIRNYISIFHSVPSQNNMPIINNPWNKDKPLPKPTPRSKTDHMKTTTTEHIVQETKQYLKYPRISSKTGSWSRSSVSAPTPRISTAWDGTTREETTTTGSKTVTDKPAVPAKKDKDGNIISSSEPAVTHDEYQQVWNGYSGEYSLEYRWVQQGHNKMVGGKLESWAQTITYDYLEITDVAVYEISESIVDGMRTLTSTDKIKGRIVQGKPSVFYNIDSTNTAKGGRLVYSLETSQNDHVTWDEGNSDNAENNMTNSGNVNEEAIWKKRKETLNSVTVVSDFLVLQTTQGDKSIVYFEQTSSPHQTQKNIELAKSSLEEQWDRNSTSASNWESDAIEISGYTGNYKDVNTAHSSKKVENIATAHDANNTSVTRPLRPTSPLRLTKTSIDIIDDIPNSEYITGKSKVFYKKVLPSKGNPEEYTPKFCSDFGKTGLEIKSTYSRNHSKVNDIVVHNPVSVQDAMVESLPMDRDQRTKESLPKNMEIDTSIIEYDRVLVEVPVEPEYKMVKIPNPLFKKLKIIPNPDYKPGEFVPGTTNTFNYTGSEQRYVVPHDGKYILEVYGAEGGGQRLSGNNNSGPGGLGGYSKGEIDLKKGEILYLYVGGHGNSSTHGTAYGGYNGGGSGYASNESEPGNGGGGATDIRRNGKNLYDRIIVAGGGGGGGEDTNDSYGNGGGTTGSTNHYPGTQTQPGLNASFGYGASTNRGDGGGGGGGYYGGGTTSSDNVGHDTQGGGGGSGYIGKVNNAKTQPSIQYGHGLIRITLPTHKTPATGDKYIIIPGSEDMIIDNPNYESEKAEYIFPYTGNKTNYHVPVNDEYILETWGAQGGGSNGQGGKGAYSKSTVHLQEGQVINVLVGGQGRYATSAGGGGGGTFIVDNNNTPLCIAGGGGGQQYTNTVGEYSHGRATRQGGIAAEATNTSEGYGGKRNNNSGSSGGGGFYSNGTSGDFGSYGYGYLQGGYAQTGGVSTGTPYGGFGGGASTHGNSGGGGGAGGYTGGSGGNHSTPGSGGGGGSYHMGNNSITISGSNSFLSPTGVSETGHSGNGYAKVSLLSTNNEAEPKIHIIGTGEPKFIEKKVLITGGATTKYEYKLVPRKVETKPVTDESGTSFIPGNFINIDYGFQIYFPNKGDFYGNGSSGLDTTSFVRGKGYINNMDTTEWTKNKSVAFSFNVIHDGVMYRPMEEIPLDVNKKKYNFYLPLSVREAASAKINFSAKANNCHYFDADSYTNRVRSHNKEAKHSAYKPSYVDIVGRIGNLVIEDTGDWRLSNLFKQPIYDKWFIQNVVYKVDQSKQRNIISDKVDIRGNPVSPMKNYLNTYGTIPSFNLNPIKFPLSPSLNNIESIKNQPQRLGYLTYMDISTIGNYNKLQIIPYYYNLSLIDGSIQPLDVYMNTETGYRPINIFDIVKPDWNSNNIYPYYYNLDWDKEKSRRCVSNLEENTTEDVLLFTKQVNSANLEIVKDSPYGVISSGTAQLIQLDEKNRTYIGTSKTNGIDNNPSRKIIEPFFSMNSQRWHFKVGLPSSAVTVQHNKPFTQSNILANNNSVIIMTLDIKIYGETYNLDYKHPSGNGTVTLAGKDYDLNSIPYNVISVYSTNKSSAEDLSTSGTH
ncbi:hypothetical protein AN1V17_03290 [Vallitalea sediminicola]